FATRFVDHDKGGGNQVRLRLPRHRGVRVPPVVAVAVQGGTGVFHRVRHRHLHNPTSLCGARRGSLSVVPALPAVRVSEDAQARTAVTAGATSTVGPPTIHRTSLCRYERRQPPLAILPEHSTPRLRFHVPRPLHDRT